MKKLIIDLNGKVSSRCSVLRIEALIFICGREAIILDTSEMADLMRLDQGENTLLVPPNTLIRKLPVTELVNAVNNQGNIDWGYTYLETTDDLDSSDEFKLQVKLDVRSENITIEGGDINDWSLSSYMLRSIWSNTKIKPPAPVIPPPPPVETFIKEYLQK